MKVHIDQVLEVYKTHLKNLTELFCAKQYKFSLLTKLLGLSYNTKHINTKYRLFCDQNKSGDIATSYIPTDQQPANSFTKALSPIKFSLSISAICYELKSLELDNRTTLVLSNTRELDRELFYKLVYLIQSYRWSMLITVHPTLNNHMQSMRPTCGVHVV